MIMVSFFLFFNLNCYAQNTDQKEQQSFSITTDPSQIQLNVSQPSANVQSSNPSTLWMLVKMIFSLAIVVGISYGVFYLMKRNLKTTNDNDPFLRQVSQITLSPGKSVQVVTLQNNAYLIGVTDSNINLLGKIEDEQLINAMNLYADGKNNVKKPRSFAEILDIFMPGSSKEGNEDIYSEDSESPVDELKRQREKLNSENNV